MDRYKSSTLATFDGPLATGYDRSFGPWFCRMERWDEAVLATIGPRLDGARVLDVGCASGRLLERLAARARQAAGADLAPRILETARRRLEASGRAVELRVADVEVHLPWTNAAFDVVTLTGVLHHLPHPERALAEIRRVLCEDGLLVVVDPCFFTPARQLANILLRWRPIAGDHRFHAPAAAADLLARKGFIPSEPRRVAVWSFLIAATGGRRP